MPEVSPVERVLAAYARMARARRPEVWISVRTEGDALRDAQDVARRLDDGEDLPLAGLTLAVKDNVDVAGLPTTAACPSYAYRPAATAPAVARLQTAGAVVIGKTNMDQFATGLTGTRSPHGAVRHTTDPARISGGSSSGSAVAVALGIADIGIGTDTAGSGRVPAALNGIVGLKPTRGVVPTAGVVPACADYDCISFLTRDVATAALALRAAAGPDPGDLRGRAWPADVALAGPAEPRIGVPRDCDLSLLVPAYRAAFADAVDSARRTGIGVVEVDVSALLDAARLLYDGAVVAQRWAAVGAFLATEPPDADPTVRSIIQASRDVDVIDYIADGETLLGARAEARRLFADLDALLLPTTTEHPTIAEVGADPFEVNRRLGTYTNFCNLLDLASVAVPAGEADGLPFGAMLVVPAFADQVAVDLAARWCAEAPSPGLVDGVEVAVFGAHLRGQPLNHQLLSLGARFATTTATTDSYRLVALDTRPPKPGLVPVAPGAGAPIVGELWRLTPAALGTLLSTLPPPMTLTAVTLADGRQVVGFGCTPDAAATGVDITDHGGWARYLASSAEASVAVGVR